MVSARHSVTRRIHVAVFAPCLDLVTVTQFYQYPPFIIKQNDPFPEHGQKMSFLRIHDDGQVILYERLEMS